MSFPDARQYAPATERNREPILNVLRQVLPPDGTVLEISSGTGEHAVFFAPRLAPRLWLPSDPNPQARASIAAWRQQIPAENLYPPIALDVRDPVWAVEQNPLPEELQGLNLNRNPIRAIVNINMIHISPWSATLGLMAGVSRLLPGGGILYLYGPYRQNGRHTAPSNAAFDQSLQMQNPDWGVRDLEAVVAAAAAEGLSFLKTWEMPANNFSVVFEKL
ncbi:DUF938 domain-containing protein [Leptolyngbya sp. FACHB-711]|uniref:DUF938 domain-containing protein n=1 Tax=unclassified Leptolyngbya TaxID=2650499 RepID=UPI001684E6F7|nr:DUF938 domain-containing protein [Leptolyngbya sp. FACHB-711]MBD1850378.1 DUF938 domain-containing protein [Cyanobacteria bacterium FACHB-502]MBD2024635.1 DUF938 domain-containing protein [Leptolyngbya sp. FACHB-711]